MSRESRQSNKIPAVSIVIPTFNSIKTLQRALNSITKQTYPNIEVIVVDRHSVDGTAEVARAFGAKVIQVNAERAHAKNVGLKLARGKYVLFIDSDMELTPTVVEECVTVAESNPAVASVTIPEVTVGNTIVAKIRRYERQFYQNTYIESPRFYRRNVAIEVGGFDPDVVFYEEATLAYKVEKIGYRRARIRSYIIHHEDDLTISQLLRKRYYYGKTLPRYVARYRDYANLQLNVAYRLQIFLKKGFWQQPHMAIALLALKGLEYLTTKLGTLSVM